MRRQARLDAPGILHHVMVRGLEHRPIFRDDVDRRDFCTRLEGLAYLALEVCGYTGSAAADLLGVRPSAVYRAAQRGRTARVRWERVLTVGETEKNIRKQRPL